jgi:hypothetical protein
MKVRRSPRAGVLEFKRLGHTGPVMRTQEGNRLIAGFLDRV